VGVGCGGEGWGGERLNAHRTAGPRMWIRIGEEGLLVTAVTGSVHGAVVVAGCCFSAILFFRFHSLRLGLLLQFSVLPLGGEGS